MRDGPNAIVGGKYQVVRLLGQGGMGTVYEAIHLGTGRRVALKLISGDRAWADPAAITRFQREARSVGAIESRHVVQVLDAGVDEVTGGPYMAMELLSGTDLLRLVRARGPLTVDLALRVAAQACAGAHHDRTPRLDRQPYDDRAAARGARATYARRARAAYARRATSLDGA